MDANRVHPELQGKIKKIPAIPFYRPLVRRLFAWFSRLSQGFKGDDRIRVSWLNHGQARSKLYQPVSPTSDAAILMIHGGGYLIGHPAQSDALCQRLIDALGIAIVSVDYRLAPKHPFPAPLDDCMSAWHYVQQNADKLGINPAKVVIAGQSAGGGLAACLAQKICDEGGQQPLAQLLYYPMLDDRTALNHELSREQHFLWDNRNNETGWACYLNQTPGQPEAPTYSVAARCESLEGLPECWIGVGDIDLFLQEDVSYAERLREAGVPCELLIVEGGPHGFDLLFPDSQVADECFQSAVTFLRRVLPATAKG